MKKAVLLASCIIMLSVPGIAAAQVAVAEPEEDRVSFTVGAATDYMLETQAFEVKGPVVNGGVTYQFNENFSANLWGQYGEDDLAKEIDATVTGETAIAGIDVSVTAGAYLYPWGGSDTIYTAGVAASIPLGPVSLDLSADRYEGGFENTTLAAAISGSAGPVDVTFGKAFNTGDINPWFAGASIPVGPDDLGIRLGVRAFWGADEGAVLELTRSF